jgi:phosphatidylglycerol:prolipoprotein diacylglycerol transferase
MHSILFHLGPIPIYSYGLMLMLAFLAASTVAMQLAKQRGIEPEHVLDLAAAILVAAILGSRLLYVALQWHFFRQHLADIGQIWQGGLSFHGGLIGGLLAGIIYCRRHGLSFLRMGDVVAPGAAVGYAIGRIGCFLNGCCYGAPTSLPWACQFRDPPITGSLTPPSHPTQIYASLINLGIFALLLWIWRRQRFTGQVLWSYLLFYAIYRFGIEFLRKGATAEVFAASGLTHSQWASIAMVLIAGGALLRLSRHGEPLERWTLAVGKGTPGTEHRMPKAKDRLGAVGSVGAKK